MNGKNGTSGKRDRTAAKIIEAVKDTHGLLTLTALKTGLGYRTVCRYAAENPAVKAAVEEAREGVLDVAEGKLYRKILDGNMTAIIFFLKTKGKNRGYSERQEITGADGEPVLPTILVQSGEHKALVEKLRSGKWT